MKQFVILLLLATIAFSQEDFSYIKNAEVDSAAYYEKEYLYHFEKYQRDENISKKALFVTMGSIGIAGALGMFILIDEIDRKLSSESGYTMSSPLVIVEMSLFSIFLISDVVYASYGTFASIEKKESDAYNEKRKAYQSRHITKISVVPQINPIEQKYGGILALNF